MCLLICNGRVGVVPPRKRSVHSWTRHTWLARGIAVIPNEAMSLISLPTAIPHLLRMVSLREYVAAGAGATGDGHLSSGVALCAKWSSRAGEVR